jgi:hypothetical protein
MQRANLFVKVGEVLAREPRLIHLPPQGRVVFVGDTHGDLDAARQVIHQYLKRSYRIVFLGDYVDRGNDSEENIHYLLEMKQEYPDDLFLLSGNHEGYMVKQFHPASFWDSLSVDEKAAYGLLFSKLPLAVTSENGILALHGGIPDLGSIQEINRVEWGDAEWDRIVWGDFVEAEDDLMEEWGGRPQLGRPYFERMMERYQKRILIRSHQPHAPALMFNKRCITIFTSCAYMLKRTVAIANLEEEIRDAEDLTIEPI